LPLDSSYKSFFRDFFLADFTITGLKAADPFSVEAAWCNRCPTGDGGVPLLRSLDRDRPECADEEIEITNSQIRCRSRRARRTFLPPCPAQTKREPPWIWGRA
jgi:hypothetical protein